MPNFYDLNNNPVSCEKRVKWLDLGSGNHPRHLRSIECIQKRHVFMDISNVSHGNFPFVYCSEFQVRVSLRRPCSTLVVLSANMLKAGNGSKNKLHFVLIASKRKYFHQNQ